jgi:hypothetical protein
MRSTVLTFAAAVLLVASGCAGRRPPVTRTEPGAVSDFVLSVHNKSTKDTVPVRIWVDETLVAEGTSPYWIGSERREGVKEIRLRLAPGVHRVRAEVDGQTAAADVEVRRDETLCQVLYDDRPNDLGHTVVPAGLRIEPIGKC